MKYNPIDMMSELSLQPFEDEIFKPIFRYEDYYSISNYARVRSEERLYYSPDKICLKIKPARMMKIRTSGGACAVQLSKMGVKKVISIPRTVYQTFTDVEITDDIVVYHFDGVYMNNHFSNLRHALNSEFTKMNWNKGVILPISVYNNKKYVKHYKNGNIYRIYCTECKKWLPKERFLDRMIDGDKVHTYQCRMCKAINHKKYMPELKEPGRVLENRELRKEGKRRCPECKKIKLINRFYENSNPEKHYRSVYCINCISKRRNPGAKRRRYKTKYKKMFSNLPYVNRSIDDLPGEIWEPLEEPEGYAVSTLGRAKSLCRTIITSDNRKLVVKERVLSQGHMKNKTNVTVFINAKTKNGKYRSFSMGNLVLQAFRGKCPDGYTPRHINERSNDNRLENLEYQSPRSKRFISEQRAAIRKRAKKKAIIHKSVTVYFEKENTVKTFISLQCALEQLNVKKHTLNNALHGKSISFQAKYGVYTIDTFNPKARKNLYAGQSAERNETIYKQFLEGTSRKELSGAYNLSRGMISAVLNSFMRK